MSNLRNDHNAATETPEIERIKERHEQLQRDLESAQKANDVEDKFDTIVYGTFSMLLAHFFIKHKVSANAVTLLSLLFGIIGSFFFFSQHVLVNFIGILIEFFAVVLDCADGQVARMTHTSSQLGRFLDGVVDTICFFAVYFSLGLRMTNEVIPFSAVKWGIYIWIVLIINGYFHGEQARMADYFRSLHLSFLDHGNKANFTTSRSIRAEINESKDTPLYNRLYLNVYYLYTTMQEKMTPRTQKLLLAIDENGGTVSKELSEAFTSRSRKYVQLTNVLTFNLRAYVLYLLVLLKLHPFFFPFNIIVLGGIMVFMVRKYEKIAKEVYDEFFA